MATMLPEKHWRSRRSSAPIDLCGQEGRRLFFPRRLLRGVRIEVGVPHGGSDLQLTSLQQERDSAIPASGVVLFAGRDEAE